MSAITEHPSNSLWLLLMPSWLSGLLAVVAGIIVTGGVILAFSAHTSNIQQQLIIWQNNRPVQALTTSGQVLPENDKPTLAGSWPLLLFWASLGFVVYFLATGLARSIRNAAAFRETLGYTHVNKEQLVRSEIEIISTRTIIGVLWLVFIAATFRYVIPYSIIAAHASSSDLVSMQGAEFALLSFASITLCIQVHAIFLRLLSGRLRTFTSY